MGKRIAVVGGGLAGLAAAALLARDGHTVELFEAKAGLGGMAASEEHDGALWNWGGHALYRHGPGVAVLRDLGVDPQGALIRGAPWMEALHDGRVQPAPFSPATALAPLLSWADRLEFSRFYAALPAARRSAAANVTVGEWLDARVHRPRVRELVLSLVRLSSFAHDPARQSADAAAGQLRLSLRGVWYLHGGWQQLVDGLRAAASAAGVTVHAHERVEAIVHDTRVRALRLASGQQRPVDAAVVAVGGPRACARLLDGPAAATVDAWADRAVPVRAATWELTLRGRPQGSVWVLGVDEPVYVNVHSHFARVAADDRTMVHVVRYLGPDDPSPSHRDDMARALDAAMPGWRDAVLADRFLPALTVTHDLPTAAGGGLPGRPGPQVPGVDGLAVAGDWVGARGILADAALVSASTAAASLSGTEAGITAEVTAG